MDAVMNSIPMLMALVLGSAVLYELIVGKVLFPVRGGYRPSREKEPVFYWAHVVIKIVAALALAGLVGGPGWGVH